MRKAMFSVALLAGILALAGCPAPRLPGSDLPALEVGENADGQTVSIRPGQALIVSLAGNRTTGYRWEAEQLDPAVLVQTGEPVYIRQSGRRGAPGEFRFAFRATGAGRVQLRLRYHRPWENRPPNRPPNRLFHLTVDVK